MLQAARVQWGGPVLLVGADLPGGPRAPQRGSLRPHPAGGHVRHVRRGPPQGPHPHRLPGQVCATQAQGMHCETLNVVLHVRHVRWGPTQGPHSHSLPGQVYAAQAQGMV